MKHHIQLTVNGEGYELDVADDRRLIDVLREDLGLTGTKEGCGVGVCGACTVIVDGKVRSACLTLAVMMDGREITTVEGLAEGGKLHPIQQEFIKRGAFQCGFCTPGMLMTTKALLDENPHPSEGEIREGLTGNLCRCTGYYKIVEAVQGVTGKDGGIER